MSNYIVLVKQVPDVSRITDNAFDPESGTLIRSRLVNVINDLDTQAFAFASQMKKMSGDNNGKIVCLSMGPPMAEEVLKYCLARSADIGILLTDKALGGADTCATANPLAFAVRKIVAEIFNGSNDYYILAGMQSVDGDTAQVPAQVAEELQISCLAYVTGVEFKNNRFEFKRIISDGSQIASVRKLPAVITVAKYEFPLFASFTGTRKADKAQLIRWGVDDIKATHIGVKGSKTSVIRVFPPGKSTRKCQHVTDAAKLADIILKSYAESSGSSESGDSHLSKYALPANRKNLISRTFETTIKENEDYKILANKLVSLGITDISKIDDAIKERIIQDSNGHFHKKSLEDVLAGCALTQPTFTGEVWVAAEHSNGGISPATLELIGKARELADSLQTKVGVCLVGSGVEGLCNELIVSGADNIYLVEHNLLNVFDPCCYRKAMSDCISKYWPQIVLFAATPQGRMLAPMVAYRTGCGLTADCTSLDIRDSSRKGQIAILLQTRPALGGNVMASICTRNSKSQMATARPGVMKKLAPDYSRKGNILKQSIDLTESDLSLDIIKTEQSQGSADFSAPVIVSGGKGMQNRDSYDRLVNKLCNALTIKLKTTVNKGASRAAVEHGFIDRPYQVGQTGTSVGPKIYIALGISGAIQHMIGIANAETIIAVNTDPNAPIFKQCDYYLVGHVEEVVPLLTESLKMGT
ncbi:MAG: FAD-binding protein [Phycisphaerae bacterium]|jgi:electron transfer flavoprotein alpha subunit